MEALLAKDQFSPSTSSRQLTFSKMVSLSCNSLMWGPLSASDSSCSTCTICLKPNCHATLVVTIYNTQNLLRITFSLNDLMLKTNRLKKDFFYKDRLIFGLHDPVANMSIRHVYYA